MRLEMIDLLPTSKFAGAAGLPRVVAVNDEMLLMLRRSRCPIAE